MELCSQFHFARGALDWRRSSRAGGGESNFLPGLRQFRWNNRAEEAQLSQEETHIHTHTQMYTHRLTSWQVRHTITDILHRKVIQTHMQKNATSKKRQHYIQEKSWKRLIMKVKTIHFTIQMLRLRFLHFVLTSSPCTRSKLSLVISVQAGEASSPTAAALYDRLPHAYKRNKITRSSAVKLSK